MLRALWERPRKRQRRRGGWRQRMDASSSEEDRDEGTISILAAGHLLEWSDGESSAVRVVQHMLNARADGLCHPMVDRIAGVGTSLHAHARLRTLFTNVGVGSLLTTMPPGGAVDTLCLPSSVVRLLHGDFARDFRLRLGADSSKCRAFWEGFLSRPETSAWAAAHPFLKNKTVADLVCAVPCVLHTDAGPFSKSASTNCISWSSILSDGPEKLTKYLICSYVKESGEVDAACWSRILTDFDALAN
eukprot:6746079-Pyramimonas_sp.AAC.1